MLAKGTTRPIRYTALPFSLASYAPTRTPRTARLTQPVGAQLAGEGHNTAHQVHRAAFFASKLRSHQDTKDRQADAGLWEHSLLAKGATRSIRYTALPFSLASYAPTRTPRTARLMQPVGAQLAGEGHNTAHQVHRAAVFASKLRSHQDTKERQVTQPVGAKLAGEGCNAVHQVHRAAFFASKLRSHQNVQAALLALCFKPAMNAGQSGRYCPGPGRCPGGAARSGGPIAACCSCRNAWSE